MRILPILFPMLVVPAFAFAQCPTAGALVQGVSLSFDNLDTESYYLGANDVVINDGSDNAPESASEWKVQLTGGIFEFYFFERIVGLWQPTTVYSLDYGFDIESALPLSAGAVGGGVQELVSDSGGEPVTYSYSVHDAGEITIGDCSYAALDVFQTYLFPDSNLGITRTVYLPELGFGYLVDAKWPDEPAFDRIALTISNDG